jgi:hypothetical protein
MRASKPNPGSGNNRGGIGLRVLFIVFLCFGLWILLTAFFLSGCAGSFSSSSKTIGLFPGSLSQLPPSFSVATSSPSFQSADRHAKKKDNSNTKIGPLLERARALLEASERLSSEGSDASTNGDEMRQLALSIALSIVEEHVHGKGDDGVKLDLSSIKTQSDSGSIPTFEDILTKQKSELNEGIEVEEEIVSAPVPSISDEALNEMMHSRQTCYVQSDESEICVYHGTFCFDGLSPLVTVDNPVRDPERINDYTHSCMDPRFYEPSSLEDGGCAYMNSGERRSFNTSRWPPKPSIDTPMSLRLRRWGPINRNGLLFFKEVSPKEIWGDQPKNVFGDENAVPKKFQERNLALSSSKETTFDTMVDRFGPFQIPELPGLKIRKRTFVNNVTIDWLDGALWIAGIDGQWFSNPYHWFSKIGALFDSLRSNYTPFFGDHPSDGYPQWTRSGALGSRSSTIAHPQIGDIGGTGDKGGAMNKDGSAAGNLHNPFNKLRWLVGPQWRLPSMDFLFFAGDGANVLKDKTELKDWFRSTLELSIQPHTQFYFNDALKRLSPNRLVCSTTGVIPGGKNKLFTGRADAWLFRQYAYQMAGLHVKGISPHPKYPPRKITIIDRKGMNGRGIFNRELLVDLVRDTGVPYELVSTMASSSFNAQVHLMAETGILIAPHGAALANIMFLPAHAVVIELFPHLMKKNTYRYLASQLDLHYFPIFSWKLLPRNYTQFYGVALMNEMYFWENCIAVNITSYDALNFHACNAASKNYPIVIEEDETRNTLRDAVDVIGAFSLKNPAWKAEFTEKKHPAPSPPSWAVNERKGS